MKIKINNENKKNNTKIKKTPEICRQIIRTFVRHHYIWQDHSVINRYTTL